MKQLILGKLSLIGVFLAASSIVYASPTKAQYNKFYKKGDLFSG